MNTGPTSTATPVATRPKAITARSTTRAAVTASATRKYPTSAETLNSNGCSSERYSSLRRSLRRCTWVTSSCRARKIGWSVRSCVKLMPMPGIGAR